MKLVRKTKLWSILTGVCAFLLSILLVGTHFANTYAHMINKELGINTSVVVKDENAAQEDTQYYKSHFTDNDKLRDWQEALCEQIQGEGSVLVKNDNKALPVSKGIGVTTLGRSSADIIYGGTGSGQVDTEKAATLGAALKGAGFKVNDAMLEWYGVKIEELKDAEVNRSTAGFFVQYEDVPNLTRIAEIPTSEVRDSGISLDGYKDLALVVIGRSGGEGNDLPEGEFLDGVGYYEIQEEERELLRYVKSLGFGKTVVLINSSNAMSLRWIDEPDLGVDACLWIGGPGQYGLNAVAKILCGDVNPSGRFVDTYSASTISAPAMRNFGAYAYTNADRTEGTVGGTVIEGLPGDMTTVRYAVYYMVYQEGIYVGYKYYETRYEDTVLKQGNADGDAGVYCSQGGKWNYRDEVDYAFGYGLSYTTFSQELLDGVTYDSEKDTYTLKVKVTNTGDVAGKDVVQVYAQQPYTEFDRQNGIEKASVQLVGFGKTRILEPGQSETVEITVERKELATYDAFVNKTYIMEAGDYYLAVGSDAHDALNNILAAKGYSTQNSVMDRDGNANMVKKLDVAETDTTTYAYSSSNLGVKITNQFEAADLNYYGDGLVRYLTRNDWQGTYPRTNVVLTATDRIIHDLNFNYEPDPGPVDVTLGSTATNYKVIMMRGREYDDDMWDALLDQLTLEEMIEIAAHSGFGSKGVASVSMPDIAHADGPQGIKGSHSGGQNVAYTSEVVMASTFNTELMYNVGLSMGEDALRTNDGITGWYGPAMNIHRTPYAGRNYEYYSEDGFLSGKMAASEVSAAQEMGLISYMKHFAVNDFETYRQSAATFSNEQAIREIYLKPFQYGVEEGGSRAIMSSYNRIGCRWSGAHKGLLTEVLRNEWGFKGVVITDAVLNNRFWMDVRIGLEAGNDTWLCSGDFFVLHMNDWVKNDSKLIRNLRTACHNFLYAYVNSTAINGVSSTGRIETITPAWQIALYTLDAVLGVAAVTGAVFFALGSVRRSGKKQEQA